MKRFITRSIIIAVWILLIACILYFPSCKILPLEDKSINVFAWGDTLDEKIIADFEKQTGITVHLNHYASNEELQVKMKATRGRGYDLVMPSDYTVSQLIKADLLKPLDHSKLDFLNELSPILLNHFFDPGNQYSVPFLWEIYGLGVDRDYFKDKPFSPSWRAIYDPNVVTYKIALSNDPIEAVIFSAFYLFKNTDPLTKEQFAKIRTLLLKQRPWVEAYTDFRADYFLATGNCPLTLSTNPMIKRIKALFPQLDFVIPEEGTFISIENFCIPKASRKEKYVYQLLNYLYRKKSIIQHYENFGFFPATKNAVEYLNLDDYEKDLLQMSREDFEKFHFIKNIYPQRKVRDLWVEVKSF